MVGLGGGGTGFALGGGITVPKTYVDDVFGTFLYDGNDGTQPINNGIDLAGPGGMVWIKARDTSSNHFVHDTARERTRYLNTNEDYDQSSPVSSSITSWNSDGFTLGSSGNLNSSYSDFTSWTFRKSPGFLDIVTWPGDSTSGRQIPHSLGSSPGMIILKCISHDQEWVVWHRSAGQYEGRLNQVDDFGWEYISGATDANFTITYAANATNLTGRTYIAYVFAHDDAQFGTNGDESIIKCGGYNHTNGTDTIVDIGFEPQWVITRPFNINSNWDIIDTMRGWFSGVNSKRLAANQQSTESTATFDLTRQGFVISSGNDTSQGIYMAIRRPHKPPTSATEVFAMDRWGATSPSPPTFTSGFPVDTAIRIYNNGANKFITSRFTGTKYLVPSSVSPESDASLFTWDFMDGWGSSTGTDSNYLSYMFKRAPGFFDAVGYKSTVSAQAINHNLGVVPELIIIKNRDNNQGWPVYYSGTGATKASQLNNNYNFFNVSSYWNNTAPTATQFTVGTDGAVNETGNNREDYMAFLFATLSGISMVGSYNGDTNNPVDVDCGFASNARFVLIKRTNTSGDWYTWDTLRGITSGSNDPYTLLNTTDPDVIDTDYIEAHPSNVGFRVNSGTSGVPAALNATGSTYLFLAIA